MIKLEKINGEAKGIKLGTAIHTEDEKDILPDIIKTLNESYEVELTDDDKIDIKRIREKLKKRDDLHAVVTSGNTLVNIKYRFDKVVNLKTPLPRRSPRPSRLYPEHHFNGHKMRSPWIDG